LDPRNDSRNFYRETFHNLLRRYFKDGNDARLVLLDASQQVSIDNNKNVIGTAFCDVQEIVIDFPLIKIIAAAHRSSSSNRQYD